MRSLCRDYPKSDPFMTWGLLESEQAFATGWQKWLENMAAHEEYVFLTAMRKVWNLWGFVV